MASPQVVIDLMARDRASAVLDKAGKSAERSGKKFGGLGKVAGLAGAAAGVMALKFGKDSVAAFKDAEQSSAALDLALKKFPKTQDVTRASLDKLNMAMSKKVAFDDDAFASGQAVLAQFDLTGKQIQQITPLLADYATKTGQDLPTAAGALGKAYLGNTKALKALGINYKSTGDRATDVANINELLRQKVGGAAEAMGTTAAGKAKILENQYGNLQETVGAKLVPVLTKAADVGLRVIDFISRNSAVIGPLAAGVAGLALVIWGVNAAQRAWTAATAAWAAVSKVAAAGQWLLNAAMSANPIGLVVVAIGALVAGLVIAYKKSETFRQIVTGSFNAVLGAVKTAVSWIRGNWPLLLGILTGPIGLAVLSITRNWDTIVGVVKGLPRRIASAAHGMWDGIKDSFRSAVNWIINKWNDLSFTIGGGSVFGKDLPSVTLDTPNIPNLAAGGIVPATPGGRIVRVAEAGRDEAIIPLPQGGSRRGGGGETHVHIHVAQGFIGSEQQLARAIKSLLLTSKRTTGVNLGLS